MRTSKKRGERRASGPVNATLSSRLAGSHIPPSSDTVRINQCRRLVIAILQSQAILYCDRATLCPATALLFAIAVAARPRCHADGIRPWMRCRARVLATFLWTCPHRTAPRSRPSNSALNSTAAPSVKASRPATGEARRSRSSTDGWTARSPQASRPGGALFTGRYPDLRWRPRCASLRSPRPCAARSREPTGLPRRNSRAYRSLFRPARWLDQRCRSLPPRMGRTRRHDLRGHRVEVMPLLRHAAADQLNGLSAIDSRPGRRSGAPHRFRMDAMKRPLRKVRRGPPAGPDAADGCSVRQWWRRCSSRVARCQRRSRPDRRGTSCLLIADAAGNAIAVQSVYNVFGGYFHEPNTSVLFDDRMQGFTHRPGQINPSAQGGQRILVCPVMVQRRRAVRFALASPGGLSQTLTNVQVLTSLIDAGMNVAAGRRGRRAGVIANPEPAISWSNRNFPIQSSRRSRRWVIR